MFPHQHFEAQAKDTPLNVAVVYGERSLSYATLDMRANQLAQRLRSLGVVPEVPVGICLERSLELVVAVLGLLKAGGVYVPLDPSNPQERLCYIANETRPKVLITNERMQLNLPKIATDSVYLDPSCSTLDNDISTPVENLTCDGNLGFLIYTSGSTGEPKAVMLTHRSRDSRITHEHKLYQMSKTDRHVLKSSISFTLLIRELFWPLLTGGQLVVTPPGTDGDIQFLLDLIAKHKISLITLTPSTLRIMLSSGGLERCRSLRHVICFGEPFTTDLQSLYHSKFTAELSVYYGATEAPSATYRKCEKFTLRDSTDLGHPLPGVQLYLLNHLLERVPDGVSGEIYLGGKLARGYFRRPHLTAEKFVPHPFSETPGERLYKTGDLARTLPDGSIEFVGRTDDLVKIRGFRVELGEIAKAIRRHDAIKDAYVLVLDDNHEMARIVAYVVPAEKSKPTAGNLRSYLRNYLPDYMLPARFVIIDALPLSPNGKINRGALPEVEHSRPELPTPYTAPRNEFDKILVQIWEDILDIHPIGIHDSVFDLGGDSLAATQVVARVIQHFHFEIPLQALFQSPTIADMAAVITEHQGKALDEQGLAAMLDELESLSDEEAKRMMSKCLFEGKK